MKNWNFSLRDGNDHLNIDFETNSVVRIQEKLNAFFQAAGVPMPSEVSMAEELECMLTGLQDTYKAVCDDGNDPIREDELGELMDALERVIEYVESEL
jgi:uncharacterized protein YgfB (UPF0149 family)